MTQSPTCSNCGETLSRDDNVCPSCGVRRPDPILPSAPTFGATSLLAGTPGTSDKTELFVEAPPPPDDGPANEIGTAPEEVFDGWTEVRRQLEDATRGEFEIEGELGVGGMAKVFMGRDLALGRKVAIKVMAPGLLMGPGMVDRFRQEAVTIANLQHPNIVTIHTVRQAGSLHFFVMQLVEGGSLEDVLKRPEPLPIFLAQVILYQLGTGLSFAHRRGVVHRDIKPANVLLDKEGNAILTDFGIAKVTTATNLTQTGATMGTPAYMSPEQCRAKELSGASDQYSLGVVAYEMLTGNAPFQGSPFEVMHAHTAKAPPGIRERRSDCPAGLEAAVLRMLAKEPSDRFPTVAEAIEAIGGYLPGPQDPIRLDLAHLVRPGEVLPSQKADSPAAGVPPFSPREAKGADVESRKTGFQIPRWAWAAAGVVLLAAVSAGVVSIFGPGGEPSSPPALVPPAVADITFTNPSEEVLVGGSVQVRASIVDSVGQPLPGQPVQWSSSDPAVAVVEGASEDGVVTGITVGNAEVVARAGGMEGSVSVVVSAPAVGALTVSSPARQLVVGSTLALTAVLTDATGERVPDPQVSWRSADSQVLEVDAASGLVTGRSPGRVRVTASVEEQSQSVELTVTGRIESLAIRPPAGTLQAGGTAVLRSTVTAQPAGYLGPGGIQWSSSAPTVASVIFAGGDSAVVSLQGAGESVVTARAGEARNSITLRVEAQPPAVSLRLSRAAVAFDGVEGGDPPEPQTLEVTVTGDATPSLGAVAYRGQPGGWLLPALGGPSGDRTTLSLNVDTRGLGAGVHLATVPVGAGSESAEVEVRVTLSANPASAPVQPDADAARDIVSLLTRYADAINTKNLNLVREIFPSLPQDAIDDLLRLPASDTYYLQLAPGSLRLGSRERTLDGDVMSGVLGRDNRGELVRMIYTFGRGQRGWYILSLRAGD